MVSRATLAKWAWISFTFAFLIFTPSLTTTAYGRLYTAWNRFDLIPIVCALLLTAASILLVRLILHFLNLPEKAYVYACLLAMVFLLYPIIPDRPLPGGVSRNFEGGGVLVSMMLHYIQKYWLIVKHFGTQSVALFFFLIFSIFLPRQTRSLIMGVILIFSPVSIVTLAHMAAHHSFAAEIGKFPDHIPDGTQSLPSIFVVVIASYQYNCVFPAGDDVVGLPASQEMASTSTVFHEAISPSMRTFLSIANIIGIPSMDAGDYEKMILNDTYRTDFLANNIFKTIRKNGFNSYVIGSLLPYPDWVGSDTEYCINSMNSMTSLRTLPRATWYRLLRGVKPVVVTWLPDRKNLRNYSEIIEIRYQRFQLEKAHEKALRLIDRSPRSSLVYVHYPVPRNLVVGDINGDSQARYMDNLRYIDTYLAEFIARLKKMGRWDSSMVILMGDHGFETYSEQANVARHVPLFIKLPHQKERKDVYETFPLARVRDIIAKATEVGVSKAALTQSFPDLF